LARSSARNAKTEQEKSQEAVHLRQSQCKKCNYCLRDEKPMQKIPILTQKKVQRLAIRDRDAARNAKTD
jgi:hypothetical protein